MQFYKYNSCFVPLKDETKFSPNYQWNIQSVEIAQNNQVFYDNQI